MLSGKPLELLLNGKVTTYQAKDKNLLSRPELVEAKIDFKCWESSGEIVINFYDLSTGFPIEKICHSKHYKIINNGVQLIVLEDIASKKATEHRKTKIYTTVKDKVIIPMYLKLSEKMRE